MTNLFGYVRSVAAMADIGGTAESRQHGLKAVVSSKALGRPTASACRRSALAY